MHHVGIDGREAQRLLHHRGDVDDLRCDVLRLDRRDGAQVAGDVANHLEVFERVSDQARGAVLAQERDQLRDRRPRLLEAMRRRVTEQLGDASHLRAHLTDQVSERLHAEAQGRRGVVDLVHRARDHHPEGGQLFLVPIRPLGVGEARDQRGPLDARTDREREQLGGEASIGQDLVEATAQRALVEDPDQHDRSLALAQGLREEGDFTHQELGVDARRKERLTDVHRPRRGREDVGCERPPRHRRESLAARSCPAWASYLCPHRSRAATQFIPAPCA
ncbi:MAG: hypothetical protein IPJ34_18400 [Myxococcales bacterium]|nr:hypothetical protein [Myxococcales bacterium]